MFLLLLTILLASASVTVPVARHPFYHAVFKHLGDDILGHPSNTVKDGKYWNEESKRGKLPLFSELDLGNTSVGYVMYGEFCTDIPGATASCTEARLIMDVPNNRANFDMSVSGGGVNIIGPTDSYYFGLQGEGWTGVCRKIPGYHWATQVFNYRDARSEAGSTDKKGEYFGLVHDVGECSLSVAVLYNMIFRNKLGGSAIDSFSFSNPFPINIPGAGEICFLAKGQVTYKYSSVQVGGNLDKYFALPPECAPGVVQDYCSTVFPPGNVCDPALYTPISVPIPAPK